VSCRVAQAPLLLLLLLAGCARPPAATHIQRLAILRFENLSADPSTDWMGRALSELISEELAGAPDLYAISSNRLSAFNSPQAMGVRPVSAPGISTERTAALAAGADRIAYGDYVVRNGNVQVRLTVEDPAAGKMVRGPVLSSGGDVASLSLTIARSLSANAAPFGARNVEALKPWAQALESSDPNDAERYASQAIAADPDFGPSYRIVAQIMVSRRDLAGAQAVLEQGLARTQLNASERARIQIQLAQLKHDGANLYAGLAALGQIEPANPVTWRATGDAARDQHSFAQAVTAYQKVLAIEPGEVDTWNQLGYVAAWNGDLATASSAIQHYQAARPNDANALDSMGDVNFICGHFPEAEGFYLQATRKDPNFANNVDFFKAAMARLMTGDVAGADGLADQYVSARAAVRDPAAEYYRAQWTLFSGKQDAYQQLLALAEKGVGAGNPLGRQLASTAYAELALIHLNTGDRNAAAERARQAVAAAPAGVAPIVQLLAQPSASAAEWTARVGGFLAGRAPAAFRDGLLGWALLFDHHFTEAVDAMKGAYSASAAGADDHADIGLAWALIEEGKPQDAVALLRANPLPPSTGMGPMISLWFPRVIYLRGRMAEKLGKPQEAVPHYQLFQKLGGAVAR
jgi:tetratricopeptide (TPR) repeat protein